MGPWDSPDRDTLALGNQGRYCCYSYITYICAYLKANYPVEFFAALMTVRAKVMQPKDWAQKAPEYVSEAKAMNIHIHPPSVNDSEIGFTIKARDIYFGLSGIRSVGVTACRTIMQARKVGPFKDIWDFIKRVKVTSQVIEALAIAGAFDCLGHNRSELRAKLREILDYIPNLTEAEARKQAFAEREKINTETEILKAELQELINKAKAAAKAGKKNKIAMPVDLIPYLDIKATYEMRDHSPEAMKIYERYGTLRKLPPINLKPIPDEPTLLLPQTDPTVDDLMDQFNYLGCYLGTHPARLITNTEPLASLEEDEYVSAGGQVTAIKIIKTKKGQDMAFMSISDGTATYEVVIFPTTYSRLVTLKCVPQQGDILIVKGKVEDAEACKMRADKIQILRSKDT